jgi:hypothetical protein
VVDQFFCILMYRLIDMIVAYLFVFAGWVMSIALFNMHSASAHIALGLIE